MFGSATFRTVSKKYLCFSYACSGVSPWALYSPPSGRALKFWTSISSSAVLPSSTGTSRLSLVPSDWFMSLRHPPRQ